MSDFMDVMGNISDNVQSILCILRRWKLEDEFFFKARSPWIVSEEKVIVRALSEVNINNLTYVSFVYGLDHKFLSLG